MLRFLPLLLPLLLVLGSFPAEAQRAQPGPYTPTAEERGELDRRRKLLLERLQILSKTAPGTPWAPTEETADAAVFLHIADMADRLKLYTNAAQVQTVLRGLETGMERCSLLEKGQRPWLANPGRHLRGFVSRIDGSVQPYAVVLPAGFASSGTSRLDLVLHGRGPTEVTFLQTHNPAPGSTAAVPPNQPFIELHPFGRANNGWRWAGETDVFEALERVQRDYKVDPDRTILRGFSMGGHGAWHIGLHHPSLWAGVSPGAGFSETRKYAKVTTDPPRYQVDAWHIYDAIDYALNLANTPFIAYGGDRDPQLQASLNMQEAAKKEGLPFNLIVGPDTEHRYHPDSLREIMRQLAEHRRDPSPRRIRFTTWTLKYNRCAWVTLERLVSHYSRAVVDAEVSGSMARVKATNVQELTLSPLPAGVDRVEINGQQVAAGGGSIRLSREGGEWRTVSGPDKYLRKRPGIQGPLDDAFTSRFTVVRGTGTPWSSATQAYADRTLTRFADEWRLAFRGELPIKTDKDLPIRGKEWKETSLILFGDPGSNSLLARIASRLPIKWSRSGVQVGKRSYDAGAIPVLIYPNPYSPQHYVVINSGHTWGTPEILGSNVLLKPLLPDWAVIKPGEKADEVLAADFFDENWRLPGAE
jgi:predicted esterase